MVAALEEAEMNNNRYRLKSKRGGSRMLEPPLLFIRLVLIERVKQVATKTAESAGATVKLAK
jgi:hypothetical protein